MGEGAKTPPNGFSPNPVKGLVVTVVVATADFEIYHDIVNELRDRGARFTTIQPGDPIPDETTVVIAGANDELSLPDDVDRIIADRDDPRATVQRALESQRGSARRVIGIDPGDRPGIAVLSGDDVTAVFQVPLADVPGIVRPEIEGAVDPVVRIGDGARVQGSRLIDALEDVRVELVDETGSTPHLGTGARGMGDVLAAVNIARREGDPIQSREIEPTPGEIQVIQDASRERSADNRSIPGDLARRVAKGDLSIEDAVDAHRDG